MYFDRKCKITFISHGATIYTEEGRFSDVENYPQLSDFGQEEMVRICEFLKLRRVKNDVIYSSNSARAMQSAKMVAKIYKNNVNIIDDLKPRKCGRLANMTFSQAEIKSPELLKSWFINPDYDENLEAESIRDFVTRVDDCINRIVEENIGNRVIIVTYPDVILAAIASAIGIPYDKFYQIYIKTGSATQISYYNNFNSLIYSDYKPIY